MKILIYGLNYYPEPTGIGKYTGEMAEWLAAKGHEVKVITAPPYYPQWKIGHGYANWYRHERVGNVEVHRCPLYVPHGRVTTLKRIVHLTSFMLSSLASLVMRFRWRPAVVINIVPALFTTPAAALFSKVVAARLVIHIQDFESDAMFSLGMAQNGIAARVWAKIEKFLFARAALVTTISKAMIDNAVSKGAPPEGTQLFPNWSDVSRFANVEGVRAFKASLGLPAGKALVLYSGNIGKKQGLELVVRAAQLDAASGENHFVICGDGAARQDLFDSVKLHNLKNVTFLPLQPYEKLPQLLALADVHLVIQNQNVENAVLPSKLTNILAVGGNAVITTNSDTEMGKLISEFEGIAVIVKPNCEKDLLRGIALASNMAKPNQIAINYAQLYLDKNTILSSLEETISKVAC